VNENTGAERDVSVNENTGAERDLSSERDVLKNASL
jgi:hypothetical protein